MIRILTERYSDGKPLLNWNLYLEKTLNFKSIWMIVSRLKKEKKSPIQRATMHIVHF
nr:MAG TPA: hypothetical protein [Caudoviricetes sp.]